jgi:heterodisulfide reductase subunit A-like polyferredoxin
MPISRLKKARYALDPRLSRHEKRKLTITHSEKDEKIVRELELDLKVIERLWDGLEPEKKIVKISKELGLSPAYTRILISRHRRKKAYE